MNLSKESVHSFFSELFGRYASIFKKNVLLIQQVLRPFLPKIMCSSRESHLIDIAR